MNRGLQHYSDAELLAAMGRQLLDARRAQGLSRQEVASRAVVNRNTVDNAEQGRDISMSTALRLWRSLGLLDDAGLPVPAPSTKTRRTGQPSPISPMALIEAERRRSP